MFIPIYSPIKHNHCSRKVWNMRVSYQGSMHCVYMQDTLFKVLWRILYSLTLKLKVKIHRNIILCVGWHGCVACDIQLWRLSCVFHVSSLGCYVSFHWYPSSQIVNSFALFFFYIFHIVYRDVIVTKLDQQNAHTLRQTYISRLYRAPWWWIPCDPKHVGAIFDIF